MQLRRKTIGIYGWIRSVFAFAFVLTANPSAAQDDNEQAMGFLVKTLPPVSCDSLLLGVAAERFGDEKFAAPDAALCDAALKKSMDGPKAFWPEWKPQDKKPEAYFDLLSASAARFCKDLMDAHGLTRIEPRQTACVLGVPSDPASVFGGLIRAQLAKQLPHPPDNYASQACVSLPLPAPQAASPDIVFGNIQARTKPGAGKAEIISALKAEGFAQALRAPDRYSRFLWVVMYEGPGDAMGLRPVLSLDFNFDKASQLCFSAHALGH